MKISLIKQSDFDVGKWFSWEVGWELAESWDFRENLLGGQLHETKIRLTFSLFHRVRWVKRADMFIYLQQFRLDEGFLTSKRVDKA